MTRSVRSFPSGIVSPGLQWALLLGLLTLFLGGAAFTAIEQGPNENVNNTWDGMWWAVCTMTTVGYGDIGPVTDSGRLIAVAVMLVGIGVLTMVIGATAERFVAQDIAEAEEEVADELEDTQTLVRRELHKIGQRLQELERRLGA